MWNALYRFTLSSKDLAKDDARLDTKIMAVTKRLHDLGMMEEYNFQLALSDKHAMRYLKQHGMW